MGRMHRSGKEFIDPSSPNISSKEDDAAEDNINKSAEKCRRVTPSQSIVTLPPDFSNNTNVTGSSNNTVKEQHGAITEVPPIIYNFVQKSLMLRRRLKRYKDDEESKSALELAEDKIALFTKFYVDINILPSNWKYDPTKSSNLVIMSFRGSKSKNWKRRSGKKLGFKKHKIKQPKINDVPLDFKGLKSLQEFIDIDKDTPATPAGSIMSKRDEHVLNVDVAIASAICDYAVNAFNKALETYDKKDKRKLSEVVLMKCGYNKRYNNQYWFTLTLEAVEEGILSVYNSIVSCTTDGGIMRLFTFIRDGTPKVKRENEIPRPISKHKTVKGSFDPGDYSNYTGFVERGDFDGYDYSNPREGLFRLLNCRA